ncbi:2-amino-4-hydroxy-6-hydroxymethyldihydropteridine diphosphokinase [Psychromonas sp. Urea-02u-13]|uniref:2-amino-4-hydroxy-6- hydroxymethyldihydropteridine diphosphokinase n=1 Tax=Psychromonas sp. Urea-02u-13 TaxID=2058326 RepID=UPI000C33579F|nr:2-amino-4-hydroxy-6-hydroxymethyldihydropteridine diphosphokinase [Psychromonas sp. Urea-02u-13]PKG40588.1 2-amino-4-hydroxy-6-hydroxymethyldihydropteridine diphosphokinase [Psychromonas sp. Urea-02u-13]
MAKVFVGIGSSIDRQVNIRLGIQALQNVFGELNVSPIYESEAVGFNGCNFYNLVVSFNSLLDAQAIIKKLKKIEVQQGRPEKAIKFAPRTLDLDLLLHDQLIDLTIDLPRAEILTNAFVLQPLSELAPELKHPILNEPYEILWRKFPKAQQKLWQINAMIN